MKHCLTLLAMLSLLAFPSSAPAYIKKCDRKAPPQHRSLITSGYTCAKVAVNTYRYIKHKGNCNRGATAGLLFTGFEFKRTFSPRKGWINGTLRYCVDPETPLPSP